MKRFAPLALAALLLGLSGPAGEARSWPRSPRDQAQDYLTITDQRGPGELVLLLWLAPPLVPAGPVHDQLDKYVVLGAVHARLGADNRAGFVHLPGLPALGGAEKPLVGLDGAALPADLVKAISPLQAELVQDLGGLGAGVQWFVFQAGPVHACVPGAPLSVPLDGVTYTFATPVPGC